MTDKQRNELGRLLAYILRHRPEEYGLDMDDAGWVETDALVSAVARERPFTKADLEEVVRTDEKSRYAFDEDEGRVRAVQGHSRPVDLGLVPQVPPVLLWHGTSTKSADAIERQGILPMSRQYVHLSVTVADAIKVGRRHGTPVLFSVDATRMHEDGHPLLRAENGNWLAERVDARYVTRCDHTHARVVPQYGAYGEDTGLWMASADDLMCENLDLRMKDQATLVVAQCADWDGESYREDGRPDATATPIGELCCPNPFDDDDAATRLFAWLEKKHDVEWLV